MQAAAGSTVKLTAYAKVDATHGLPMCRHPGIPVLVRVVAPSPTSQQQPRVPIDLVAVLDVSGGGCQLAPVNMMNLVKSAMELMIKKLTKDDRLAIVTEKDTSDLSSEKDASSGARKDGSTGAGKDDGPRVPKKPELMEMNDAGQKDATALVRSLALTGDNKQLSIALDKAVKLLEGRKDDEKNNRAGFVVVISDRDDRTIFRKSMNPDYSVHAFGFRDARNARVMHYIANSSSGTYGILNNKEGGISQAFEASINNMTSIIAVEAKVEISCDESTATLSAIDSGRFKAEIHGNKKSGSINAGALQAGGERRFIVYVDVVPPVVDDVDEASSQLRTMKMKVKYVSCWHEKDTRKRVEMEDGMVTVVKKGDNGSREVVAELVRVGAARIVCDILAKYRENGNALAEAAEELGKKWHSLKKSEYGCEAAGLISNLEAEMEEMVESMHHSSGLSYMLSWQTCHSLQHLTHIYTTTTLTETPLPPPPRHSSSPTNAMAGATAFERATTDRGRSRVILAKYKEDGKELTEAVKELQKKWHSLKNSEYGSEAAGLISDLEAEMGGDGGQHPRPLLRPVVHALLADVPHPAASAAFVVADERREEEQAARRR
ncbi:hypothetical protein ABZP36_009730 [Zizania latifolia]